MKGTSMSKKSAELYDHSNKISEGRRLRSGNMASIEELPEEDSEPAHGETLEAFAAMSDPSTRLPDEYYGRLSTSDRKAWHSLDPAGKKVLLSMLNSKPAGSGSPPGKRLARVAEGEPSETADLVVGDSPEGSLEANKASSSKDSGKQDTPSHSAPQSRTNDNHPGDIRRMMSQRSQREGKTASLAPSQAEAEVSAFDQLDDGLEKQIESYWTEQSQFLLGPHPGKPEVPPDF